MTLVRVSTPFVAVTDAWGRPLHLRPDDVAVIEGAVDPTDERGDLWRERPVAAYRRVTLRSGYQLHLLDHSVSALLVACAIASQ